MIEFEDSLLSGTGAAMDRQVFRLMDPVSQRMMGIRADMTPQIARIAESRLSGAPRPLRLCYAGQVLRTRGDQIRPERQFAQVGAELIGSNHAAADAEVLLMAHDALAGVGLADISIDLGLPTLVPKILGTRAASSASADLRDALDHKDANALDKMADELGDDIVDILKRLIRASGPADETLAIVAAIDLPAAAREEWLGLAAVVECVRHLAPDLTMTIDPVEHRGFEYHAGVTFTLYAHGVRGELGSGGRYRAGTVNSGTHTDGDGTMVSVGEPATGFTLFTDSLLRALPRPARPNRVYVPQDADKSALEALRADGWITVLGLEHVDDTHAEADRLNCTHYMNGGKPVPVADQT